MQTMTSKLGAFVRSLALVGLFMVALPVALVAAADARFGGPAPWSAMGEPASWSFGAVTSALTDRLSEATIADVVIRVGLAVAWVAIIVLLITVVAEGVHMARYEGIPMPSLPGLGMTQGLARVIAAGLLVVVPMLSSPNRAIAHDSPLLQHDRSATVVDHDGARPENSWVGAGSVAGAPTDDAPSARTDRVVDAPGGAALTEAPPQAVSSSDYVVRAGDSIYGIAGRLAGPDQRAVADFADRMVELNLGRQMSDGQWFTNAAYIDVGWVLQLPPVAAASADTAASAAADAENGAAVEVVDRGESLWSIADDRLGEGERWPEIYALNEGRSFDDGRTLDDPDLIQPGWELNLPAAPTASVLADATDALAEAPPAEIPADAAPTEGAPTDELPGEAVSEVAITDIQGARPENSWVARAGAPAVADTASAPAVVPSDEAPDALLESAAGNSAAPARLPSRSPAQLSAESDGEQADAGTAELITFERGAMLSTGVLALLAVRRRTRMRRASPNTRLPEPAPIAVATERALRAIDAGDRFARVDIAIRSAAIALVEHGARVEAVAIDDDGEVELFASRSVELAAPWEATATGSRWRLPASTPIELLVDDARRVGAPCPTLIQIGRDVDGRDVYLDLEALEAIEIGGPGDRADAVVAAVAATLSASLLAEVTTLVGVGIPDDAFLGHRHHRPARDVQRAFEEAADAIGSTGSAERSTFELRARVTSGETWEPAVVLAGAAVGTVTPPRNRTGLAVVSASPIHGPSSRLAPDGDAWTLLPLGLRLVPVGLSEADVAAISTLVAVPEPVARPEPIGPTASAGPPVATSADVVEGTDPDVTLVGARDQFDADRAAVGLEKDDMPVEPTERADVVEPLPFALVVRLLGPVSVESADGRVVEFERSKTKELIAWLATHRARSTRSNARAALWELDVRDGTFANVVSEARRALARLVEPPQGEEWVGRTMTDALPLHPLVVTDLDLIEHALRAARLQPPSLAIETLTPAVEWVTGVPFEGTSYLWPDAEGTTSELVLRAITVTNALASHCLSLGDIDGVFAATGRGLKVLPAHEDMIAVRMRAYAHVGDRAGVRHEWESYERAIVTDPWSDGEPSDRMVQLRQELLSN